MKPLARVTRILAVLSVALGMTAGDSLAFLRSGQPAPVFQEQDTGGKTYDLASLKDKPMIVLYFFDVGSRSSTDLLVNLSGIARRFADSDMVVWAITRSGKDEAAKFVAEASPGFPVLVDDSGVSKDYRATMVLPTVCIIGPELKVMDYFQGGGETTEVMLVRLAERNLQRKQTMVAKAITEVAVEKNPKSARAKAVKGYAELKEGNVDKAEKVFEEIAKDKATESEVIGKEGLAAVYAQKGDADKALKTAEEVVKKAPERSYAHVVKAEVLYSRDQKQEAAEELKQAVEKKEAEPHQKALAYNQFGRLLSNIGQYDQARQLYDQAVEIDPYYIEATSNKGMTYEKQGNWDKALESYQKAQTLDSDDAFSAVLLKKAAQMSALQNDAAQRERVDRLVKDLAQRFREQQSARKKEEKDTWTSRPLILSFVDFQEKGGLSERDGFSTVVITQLSDLLNAGGRVQVVERVLIERLLEELNLGSSDLADPETALQLGRVLAAKVIGTGTLFFLPDSTMMNLRLIDTETTAIAKVFSKQYPSAGSMEAELEKLNGQIQQVLTDKYPLRGFVVQAGGGRIMINIGARQGVTAGAKFEVLEEQEPIVYKGRVLKAAPLPVAVIQVDNVDQDFSYASVVSKTKDISADAKVQEQKG